jgi:4'-phosphopantetheinyl transferase
MPVTLTDGSAVAVTFADAPCLEDDEAYSAAERILSKEEAARARRFRVAKDRRRFALTRALVRRELSRYVDIPPADWRIENEAHGRPFVASPAEGTKLRFSAAHTEGLVLCAVAAGREIGADVERLRDDASLEIARHFFAPSEVEALRATPLERRAEGFFTCWTLKEAYIKARGLGLSLPLDKFAFDLAGDPCTRVEFDPALGDHPAAWRFFSLCPTPQHRAAVCVGRPDGAEILLTTRWAGAPPLAAAEAGGSAQR